MFVAFYAGKAMLIKALLLKEYLRVLATVKKKMIIEEKKGKSGGRFFEKWEGSSEFFEQTNWMK